MADAGPRRKMWRFYRTAAGTRVVEEDLVELGEDVRAAVIAAMKRRAVNESFHGEVEHVKDDLYALRVFLHGLTFRLLYASEGRFGNVLLALHVVDKRSRKLPKDAIRTASRRLTDWRSRPAQP